MVSHKIKQINSPLRFANVVLLCLIKVINMRSEQKKVHVPLLTKLNNAKSWNDLKRSLDGSQKKKVFLKIR